MGLIHVYKPGLTLYLTLYVNARSDTLYLILMLKVHKRPLAARNPHSVCCTFIQVPKDGRAVSSRALGPCTPHSSHLPHWLALTFTHKS